MATRPSSRAMANSSPALSFFVFSALGAVRGDELGERGELLLDEAHGLLVLDLTGLVVDALRAVADEDFRLVQRERIEEHHGAPQIVLHAGAADRAGRRRLQRDRLADERLIRQPRYPV